MIVSTGPATTVHTVDEFIEPRRKLLSDGRLVEFSERETTERTEIAARFGEYRKAGVMNGEPFEGAGEWRNARVASVSWASPAVRFEKVFALPGLELAISPDGTWLATTSRDRTVRVWDAATGSPVAMTRVDGDINECGWSPDQLLLYTAGRGGLYGNSFHPGTADTQL